MKKVCKKGIKLAMTTSAAKTKGQGKTGEEDLTQNQRALECDTGLRQDGQKPPIWRRRKGSPTRQTGIHHVLVKKGGRKESASAVRRVEIERRDLANDSGQAIRLRNTMLGGKGI